jgi:DNA-binding CsgD family transcriptional regulator
MKRDYLSIVEAAYALRTDEKTWLQGITDAAAPVVDDGFGVCANTFDASDPSNVAFGAGATAGGMTREELLAGQRASTSAPVPVVRKYFCEGPSISFVSARADIKSRRSKAKAKAAESTPGAPDIMSVRAKNPFGQGVLVCVPITRAGRFGPRVRSRLGMVAAHLAAALRLRMLGVQPIEQSEAIFSSAGKAEHLSSDLTKLPRSALERGVEGFLEARRLQRAEPDQAIELWSALVGGKWSVFDQFDRDGRRFIVARRNELALADPRMLTTAERMILLYASWGHSLKLISYEVGLSQSSVFAQLKLAMRKLGLRRRSELLGLFEPSPKGA